MKKENFIIDSLTDIYTTSSLSMIENSETTDKYGRKLRNYYLSAVNERDMLRTYQLTVIDNDFKDEIVVSLNIFYLKEPKSGANKNNLLVYIPNYSDTKLGYVKFSVPKKAWDYMRNGVITGVFDFVDNEIAERIAA